MGQTKNTVSGIYWGNTDSELVRGKKSGHSCFREFGSSKVLRRLNLLGGRDSRRLRPLARECFCERSLFNDSCAKALERHLQVSIKTWEIIFNMPC